MHIMDAVAFGEFGVTATPCMDFPQRILRGQCLHLLLVLYLLHSIIARLINNVHRVHESLFAHTDDKSNVITVII